MAFVEIGIQKVRIVFTPGKEPGTFNLDQDCGVGCKCQSRVSKCTPSLESAAGMILCFNDAKGQGISGRGCSGIAIIEGPEIWIYEIEAKLKQQCSDLPGEDPFPRTQSKLPTPPCQPPKGTETTDPTPQQLRIEGAYKGLDKLSARMLEKAKAARDTARRAKKQGDLRKWDKFHAIARVYEMAEKEMWSCYEPLQSLTSKAFQQTLMPF